VGVVVLGAATVAFALGATTLGWALVALVAALAGLSAVTGLCIGCEIYVALVRLQGGVRVVTTDREARAATSTGAHGSATGSRPTHSAPLPDALRADGVRWVVFSTQYCAVCPVVVAEIERVRPGERMVVLDVADHLDLAARYKVRRAPTVLRADADGSVVARLSGVEAVRRELASTAVG